MTRRLYLSAVFLVALTLVAGPATARQQMDAEQMIDRSFSVSAGDLLNIRVADADLFIETSNTDEAHVAVWLEGQNMRRARTYYESQRFTVEQRGGSIEILTDPPRRVNWSWQDWGRVRIRVEVHIPRRFNLDVQTSDGDIVTTDVDGRILIRSSDGDITVGALTGPSVSIRTSDGDIRADALESDDVTIRTSDGDIDVDDVAGAVIQIRTSDGTITGRRLAGDLDVTTSDGDIRLEVVDGPRANLKTSDGDITAGRLLSARSDVQTSDGEITLGDVQGALRAKTSSGDINVRLAHAADVDLYTADGDITIEAPTTLSAELSLRGEQVRISSSFDFQGSLEDDHADGRLGRGGARIEARASDGKVVLRDR